MRWDSTVFDDVSQLDLPTSPTTLKMNFVEQLLIILHQLLLQTLESCSSILEIYITHNSKHVPWEV